MQFSKGLIVVVVGSERGREFNQMDFNEYYGKHDISENFSSLRTPQQNGILEIKKTKKTFRRCV